jgi:serine/threonine-protein kinase
VVLQTSAAGPVTESQIDQQHSTLTTLRRRRNRGAVVLLLITAVMGAGLYLYRTRLPLAFLPHHTALDSTTSKNDSVTGASPVETGGYFDMVANAQAALLAGNGDEAVRLLDEAIKNGGEGMATNLRGHIRSALETPNAPCALRAIGRPRPFNVVENASRPTIASAASASRTMSSVVAWVGTHDDKAKRQVYTTVLDSAMRRIAPAQLVVPESGNARYPEIYQFGDQRLLLYWDASSKDSGIFARYIDGTGQMLGGLTKLATLGKDEHDPALVRDSEDRSLWLAWEEDGKDGAQNLLIRHFDSQLNPLTGEIALTALRPDRAQRPSALRPAIAESRGRIYVAFTLKQGNSRRVHSLVIPKNAPELKAGLPASTGLPSAHQFLVPVQAIGREGIASDDARLACVTDTCFTFWYEDGAGIVATAHDAPSMQQLWRHEIAPRGARPALGVDGDRLLVAWYEASRLRVSPTNRRGVGTVGTIAKVSGVQPLPDVAKSSNPNHWLLAWRDYEAGHLEVMTADVECQPVAIKP